MHLLSAPAHFTVTGRTMFSISLQIIEKIKSGCKPLGQTLAVASLLFAAGCSSFQSTSNSSDQSISQGRRLLSNYWTLDSKIGIKTPSESGSAQLSWEQMGSEYVIMINGPLGKNIGKLERKGNEVTMTAADGSQETASSEEQLVLNTLGEPLPVEQLQFWIKGIKAPFYPIEPVSAANGTTEFIQKNWRVKMQEFHIIDGYKLPSRLEFSFPADAEEQLKLKVIVKEWTLPQETAYDSFN